MNYSTANRMKYCESQTNLLLVAGILRQGNYRILRLGQPVGEFKYKEENFLQFVDVRSVFAQFLGFQPLLHNGRHLLSKQ